MTVDKIRDGSDDRPVTELAQLIRDQHDAGVSYEQMAIRARSAGHDVDRQYFQMVAKGTIHRPRPPKLAAIAAGLHGISEGQVREAAARAAGVHVEHNVPYKTAQLLHRVDDLSTVNRDRWYRLATAIAQELALEESGVTQDVIGHVGAELDEMSTRTTQRELDRFEAEDTQKEVRRRRG